ncbi:MAG: hypothetical protein KH154_15270 [Parabacteroides sp.]|uniref:hypothetical protein n=1 Tax=Parabacteroides sp. TaxID=1869337 RepID=UPI0025811548|nr:hypothetical protein [Parabacteroides sp.]MBS7101946.1 hypothetical protein [Parabacteroides sp.]
MKTSKCFDRASCSWDCKPRITGLIHDPVEESEAYFSCFEYWQVMKRFLWEDYRIEWRSPVELNPTIFKNDL